jgi:hypothetical protein
LATSFLRLDSIAVVVEEAQMFACVAHRHVLAFEFALFGPAALTEEEEPGAVDGPVAERAGTGEVERPWGEGV